MRDIAQLGQFSVLLECFIVVLPQRRLDFNVNGSNDRLISFRSSPFLPVRLCYILLDSVADVATENRGFGSDGVLGLKISLN